MAKRRKLEAPSQAELDDIEEGFRSETSAKSSAPIAKVAFESAGAAPMLDVETRATMARDTLDAEAMRLARDKGLMMVEVPLDQIKIDNIVRDRIVLDEAEMDELKTSISTNGLRLPVELCVLESDTETPFYGVISGYRRVMAVQGLLALSGKDEFRQIKALIRTPETDSAAYIAMVEENEIRASLSHFERGRIASIAAKNGVFVNVADAVDHLFASASKAKRSKVRSFAQVFEELGDMLVYPEALSERQGLRIATTLRAGGERELREELAATSVSNAGEEWDAMHAIIAEYEDQPRDTSRGGRPRAGAPRKRRNDPAVIETSTGFILRRETDTRGHLIRFEGRAVDVEMVNALMLELQRLLEKG